MKLSNLVSEVGPSQSGSRKWSIDSEATNKNILPSEERESLSMSIECESGTINLDTQMNPDGSKTASRFMPTLIISRTKNDLDRKYQSVLYYTNSTHEK